MILPTPAELAALKSYAARRFGSDRLRLCKLPAPIDGAVVCACFSLKSYAAHLEARQGNTSTAVTNVIVDRALWCSPTNAEVPTIDTLAPSKEDADPLRTVALERLDALREAWPATSAKAEADLRIAAGHGAGVFTAQRYTADTAPRGFDVSTVAPAAGPGSLWVARRPGAAALAFVFRQPLPDVWCAVKAQWLKSIQEQAGILEPLNIVREHVVWSPEPLDQLFERTPDVAVNLVLPFLEMGGQGSEAEGSFL